MIQDEFKKLKDEWSSKIMLKQGESPAVLFLRQVAVVESVVESEFQKLQKKLHSLKDENDIVRGLLGANEVEIKAKLLSKNEEVGFLHDQLLDFKKRLTRTKEDLEHRLLEIETLKRDKGILEAAHSDERKKLGKKLETFEEKLKDLDMSWNEKYSRVTEELTSQRRIYQNKLNLASVDIWRFSHDVFANWILYTRDQIGSIFGATDYIHANISGNISTVKKLKKEIEPDLSLIKEKTTKIVASFNKMAEFFSVEPELKMGDINSLLKKLKEAFMKTSGVIIGWPEEKERPKIVMDEKLLFEAISEIIKNSVEAVSTSSRTGNIDVKLGCDDIIFTIDISDNGSGIPQENIEKLFTPFFTTKPGHDGLGIVRAKRNIIFHSGEVFYTTVENKPTFRIKLTHE